MGVDEGNLQVIDVDMILEKCPITFVRNLLVCSTIQYGTVLTIVYDNKLLRRAGVARVNTRLQRYVGQLPYRTAALPIYLL